MLLGCASWLPTKVIKRTKIYVKEPYHPPRSNPVFVQLPHMNIVTPSNVDKFFDPKIPYRYAVYTWEEYLEISQVLDKLLEKIEQQDIMLCNYRRSLREEVCRGKLPPLVEQPEPEVTTTESVN